MTSPTTCLTSYSFSLSVASGRMLRKAMTPLKNSLLFLGKNHNNVFHGRLGYKQDQLVCTLYYTLFFLVENAISDLTVVFSSYDCSLPSNL